MSNNKKKTIKAFAQLYKDVLVDGCIIRVERVNANTYTIATYKRVSIHVVGKWWRPGPEDAKYVFGRCNERTTPVHTYILSPEKARYTT